MVLVSVVPGVVLGRLCCNAASLPASLNVYRFLLSVVFCDMSMVLINNPNDGGDHRANRLGPFNPFKP